jgi:hypothetical protein
MKPLKAITYDGGRIVKMDNSSTCDETIPKWENRHFNEALEMLLRMEKKARVVSIFGWILCSQF